MSEDKSVYSSSFVQKWNRLAITLGKRESPWMKESIMPVLSSTLFIHEDWVYSFSVVSCAFLGKPGLIWVEGRSSSFSRDGFRLGIFHITIMCTMYVIRVCITVFASPSSLQCTYAKVDQQWKRKKDWWSPITRRCFFTVKEWRWNDG